MGQVPPVFRPRHRHLRRCTESRAIEFTQARREPEGFGSDVRRFRSRPGPRLRRPRHGVSRSPGGLSIQEASLTVSRTFSSYGSGFSSRNSASPSSRPPRFRFPAGAHGQVDDDLLLDGRVGLSTATSLRWVRGRLSLRDHFGSGPKLAGWVLVVRQVVVPWSCELIVPARTSALHLDQTPRRRVEGARAVSPQLVGGGVALRLVPAPVVALEGGRLEGEHPVAVVVAGADDIGDLPDVRRRHGYAVR